MYHTYYSEFFFIGIILLATMPFSEFSSNEYFDKTFLFRAVFLDPSGAGKEKRGEREMGERWGIGFTLKPLML